MRYLFYEEFYANSLQLHHEHTFSKPTKYYWRELLTDFFPYGFLHLTLRSNKPFPFSLPTQEKSIFQLCNTDLVWCLIFRKVLGRMPSPAENKMAFDSGWRNVLLNRLIYIKKVYDERNVNKRNVKHLPVTSKRIVQSKS